MDIMAKWWNEDPGEMISVKWILRWNGDLGEIRIMVILMKQSRWHGDLVLVKRPWWNGNLGRNSDIDKTVIHVKWSWYNGDIHEIMLSQYQLCDNVPAARHMVILVYWDSCLPTWYTCTASSRVGTSTRTRVTDRSTGRYNRRSRIGSMKATVLPVWQPMWAVVTVFLLCISGYCFRCVSVVHKYCFCCAQVVVFVVYQLLLLLLLCFTQTQTDTKDEDKHRHTNKHAITGA